MTHQLARAAAGAAALAVALTACSGSGEGEGSPTASTSPSSSSTTTRTVEIDGAPPALRRAVAETYDDRSVTGSARTGSWRGAKVAVVTAKDDVTLAVRPKGERDWQVVGGWWPSLEREPDLGGPRHVLVIGSDARPGQDVAHSRADALQLLGVDGSGGGGLMGFARDLWVPVPGHGHSKLNSAMVRTGPHGEVEAISRVSGIDVDGYVVTGFEGFREIVDEIGPLDFDAPEALDSHLDGGQIPEGRSRLSGREALAWARERKTLPQGDIDRSRHQGLLLIAAALQARARGPESLPEALTVIDEHASSDLSAKEMLLFTAAFYRLDPTKVGQEVAQGPTGTVAGQSVVHLDGASRDAFRDFRDGRLD